MKYRTLIVLLALAAIVLPMLVAAQAPEDLSTPCALLSWAGTTTGLIVILGLVEKWAVEYIPQWPSLPSKWKRPVMYGLAFGASLLVLVGKAYLCGLTIDLQTAWEALVAAAGVFTISQVAHGFEIEGSRDSRLMAARLKNPF